MTPSSKLELALDKNVFYSAAESNLDCLDTIVKICRKCHKIVVSDNYLKSVRNKLKRFKSPESFLVTKLLKQMEISGKIIFRDPIKLSNVPRKDEDIAGLAAATRNKILLIANIDDKPADQKLVKALKNYGIHVYTCKEFVEKGITLQ